VTRLIDRWLSRADQPGYNENYYTGAEYATGLDVSGQGREGSPQGIVRLARQAYRQNGIVFACEAVKQWLFSEARFQFEALDDGHIFGDTSLRLLEHPWPNGDSGNLLGRACNDGSMGNCYFRKAVPAGGGDPVLVRMVPEKVTIISQELADDLGRTWKQPIGYLEDMGPGREPQMFTTEEVGHFAPLVDPDAAWRGMSWLTPILSDVRSDAKLTEYKTFHLDNGAMPGLVIKYAVKLSNKTIDTLRKRVRAKYGGAENAGNVLVLDEGADLAVAGSTLEQLQYDAVSKAGERRVCAAAGPGLLVICGFDKGGYQEAIRELADLWARPNWRMLCASLEHLIPGPMANPEVPVRLWYDVGGIAALREGELQRAQAFLVKAQGLASSVAAGFTRQSAVKAAETGDLALLVPSPDAPPPGVSGRETATERLGPGGQMQQPPTGGPAGNTAGRPPQGGRPQQLAGATAPNVPNAKPGAAAALPSLPLGARGGTGNANANGSPKK
jgi:hypothetical protein